MKKIIALVVLLSALSIKIGPDPNFGGDLDIETVTTKYGFDLEWSETPTVADYWFVGFKYVVK
jgi:hypothetical protein